MFEYTCKLHLVQEWPTYYLTLTCPSLSFIDAPELICPVHYEGEEGKNHNLTCSAGGMPAPTIIWSKDGKEIHIPVRLTRKESGEYNVSAINKHGTSYRKMDVNILCM